MEPRQQLEAWQAQIDAAPDADAANIDVVKRLLVHGIRALEEINRLKGCLAKANEQAEHFERQWYLRGDVIEAVRDWDVSGAMDVLSTPTPERTTIFALPIELREAIRDALPSNDKVSGGGTPSA